jgi:hypothetical protein
MIEVTGSKATIVSGERRLELELGGAPIEVSGSEGTNRVSAKLEGERLILEVRSGNGSRTTIYRSDGTGLLMEVTVTSARLAGPVKYGTTYAREE